MIREVYSRSVSEMFKNPFGGTLLQQFMDLHDTESCSVFEEY